MHSSVCPTLGHLAPFAMTHLWDSSNAQRYTGLCLWWHLYRNKRDRSWEAYGPVCLLGRAWRGAGKKAACSGCAMEAERALGIRQAWEEKFSKTHWLSDPAGPVPGQLCPELPSLVFASSAENRSGHSGRMNCWQCLQNGDNMQGKQLSLIVHTTAVSFSSPSFSSFFVRVLATVARAGLKLTA